MYKVQTIKNLSELTGIKPGERAMIVSHRGKSGGGIVENTLEAFDLALKSGADIIEADVSRTADGKFIIFHDETLGRITNLSEPVTNVNFDIIRSLQLKNVIGEPSGFIVNTLDEFLEHMKNRCLINLDKCFDYLDEVYSRVKYHNMEDQILIKFPVNSEDGVKWVEHHDYKPVFIPIVTEDKYIDYLQNVPSKAKMPIVELFIANDSDRIISEEFIESIHKKGISVWANSLVINNKRTLCAWHDDNQSLLKDPDKGWGWLVDRGIDIIQTDWPHELEQFLISRGIR